MPNCPQIECFTITIIYLSHDSACWLFGFIQQGFQEGLTCTHSICNHYWPPGGFGSGGDLLSNMCVCVVCMYMCVPVCVCEAAIYLYSATSLHGGRGFKPQGWELCGFWNPKLGNCTRSFFNFCVCNYCKASPDLGGPLLAGKPTEYCGHLVAKTKEKPRLKQVRKPRMGSSHASQLRSHSWRGS